LLERVKIDMKKEKENNRNLPSDKIKED